MVVFRAVPNLGVICIVDRNGDGPGVFDNCAVDDRTVDTIKKQRDAQRLAPAAIVSGNTQIAHTKIAKDGTIPARKNETRNIRSAA
jgi:hypothetical protein